MVSLETTGEKKMEPGINWNLGKTLTNHDKMICTMMRPLLEPPRPLKHYAPPITCWHRLLAFDRAAGGRYQYYIGAAAAASGVIRLIRHS